jgi:cysteine/O-acetylserine efflux protein
MFESAMRYIGAAYILYLAFAILKASYRFTEKEAKPLGITSGFLLQISNPKLFIYAFSLFSGFLVSMSGNVAQIVVISVLLAVVSFCATSLWAIFGTTIKTYLHHPHVKTSVNIALSLLLVYTALDLAGLL